MTTRRWLLFAAAVLTLAACGGGGKTTGQAAATTAVASTTLAPTTSATPASSATGASFRFRGMTLTVPDRWKVDTNSDGARVANGQACVHSDLLGRDVCPGFEVYGPDGIPHGYENRAYRLDQPFHPGRAGPGLGGGPVQLATLRPRYHGHDHAWPPSPERTSVQCCFRTITGRA